MQSDDPAASCYVAPQCPIPETERWGWGTDAYDGACCDADGVCHVTTTDDDDEYVEDGVDNDMDPNDPNGELD